MTSRLPRPVPPRRGRHSIRRFGFSIGKHQTSSSAATSLRVGSGRSTNDRQDKAAAPAAVRSVSTPRCVKELRRRRAVHTGNSTIQREGPALGRTAWLNPPSTETAEPMR
jgi:hypothetical protein